MQASRRALLLHLSMITIAGTLLVVPVVLYGRPVFTLIQVAAGQAQVTLAAQQPRRVVFHLTAETPATIEVGQFYFPGWQWRLSGAGAFEDARPAPASGLVLLDVPRGAYTVELRLNPRWREQFGQIINLACAACLLGWAGWSGLSARRQ